MILVLGGGLAGLSAAWHLRELLPGLPRLVLEAEDEPGGLCRSFHEGGFTFDLTGHYLHLRDPYAEGFVRRLLGDLLVPVERRARIHARGALLEFPFQANLHGLPREVVARCLTDFLAARERPVPADPRGSFETWARATFGDGIAEEFLLPQNRKVYRAEPAELTAEWVSWSVPRPSVEEVVRGALGLPSRGLGYNPRFLYPREGGIGVLPATLAREVGDDLRCGARVVSVDARERRVVLEGGEVLSFERLVSTLPLPYLLQRVRGLDGCPSRGRSLAEMAGELSWSRVVDLQLGIDRAGLADGVHWIYFPGDEYPFYRVGFPSNVAPALAPAGCSTASVEFSLGPREPIPAEETLLELALDGLRRAGILGREDRVVLHRARLLDPAYVRYDRARTPVVEAARARLAEAGIHLAGRYGRWQYSFMERALLEGREVAREVARAVRGEAGP